MLLQKHSHYVQKPPLQAALLAADICSCVGQRRTTWRTRVMRHHRLCSACLAPHIHVKQHCCSKCSHVSSRSAVLGSVVASASASNRHCWGRSRCIYVCICVVVNAKGGGGMAQPLWHSDTLLNENKLSSQQVALSNVGGDHRLRSPFMHSNSMAVSVYLAHVSAVRTDKAAQVSY